MGGLLAFGVARGLELERRVPHVEMPAQALPEPVEHRARAALLEDRGLALDVGAEHRRSARDRPDVHVVHGDDLGSVEQVLPGRMLRLRAEMKVPGRAWLQFEARPTGEGSSELVQTAYFAPKGLFGLLYWYVLYPMHALIFSGLARKVCEAAARER